MCLFKCFLTKESRKQLQQSLNKSSSYYILILVTILSINVSDPVFFSTQCILPQRLFTFHAWLFSNKWIKWAEKKGLCIFSGLQPSACLQALVLGPGPSPQPWSLVCIYWTWPPIIFSGPGPQFIFTSPDPHLVFTGPGPQFVFTDSGPKVLFTGPGLKFLLSVWSLSLHTPTLSPPTLPPQFVFTSPDLRFVIPVRDLNLHLPFHW